MARPDKVMGSVGACTLAHTRALAHALARAHAHTRTHTRVPVCQLISASLVTAPACNQRGATPSPWPNDHLSGRGSGPHPDLALALALAWSIPGLVLALAWPLPGPTLALALAWPSIPAPTTPGLA